MKGPRTNRMLRILNAFTCFWFPAFLGCAVHEYRLGWVEKWDLTLKAAPDLPCHATLLPYSDALWWKPDVPCKAPWKRRLCNFLMNLGTAQSGAEFGQVIYTQCSLMIQERGCMWTFFCHHGSRLYLTPQTIPWTLKNIDPRTSALP